VNQIKPLRPNPPVKIDAESLLRALESLPDSKYGPVGFEWTPEMDEILLRFWPVKRQAEICKLLGCSQNTARNRYRELTK
jgi:hypothetical protein